MGGNGRGAQSDMQVVGGAATDNGRDLPPDHDWNVTPPRQLPLYIPYTFLRYSAQRIFSLVPSGTAVIG